MCVLDKGNILAGLFLDFFYKLKILDWLTLVSYAGGIRLIKFDYIKLLLSTP